MENEQTGGVYCNVCAKCLCRPRKYKNPRDICYITCQDCKEQHEKTKHKIIRLTCKFRPNTVLTDFEIHFQDIDMLISHLQRIKDRYSKPI